MVDTRELNLTLDLCLRVGELLLASGAGAADVTATMRSLSWHLGVRHADIDVTFTSLSMSYQRSPEEPAVLQVRQVTQRDIDYEDLTLVDHLVRDVLHDQIDLHEARATLARITSSGHTLPRWAVTELGDPVYFRVQVHDGVLLLWPSRLVGTADMARPRASSQDSRKPGGK